MLKSKETILKIENLSVGTGDITIVKDFNMSVNKGEIIGIVGESGCGKSTMLKSIVSLSDKNMKIKGGEILYKDQPLHKMKEKELRQVRGKNISMIFQKPDASFDPLMRIKDQFHETVKFHTDHTVSKEETYEKGKKLLEVMHLQNADKVLHSYPFELSGGMNQRVAIAMAMMNEPDIILADEPTSALDVSVQSQVVRTLMDLCETTGTAILMVTHNMNVIANMVDKVGVMYAGRLVEFGCLNEVLNNPRHRYTKMLLNAIPDMDGTLPKGIKGMPPSFMEDIVGCPFEKRCDRPVGSCSKELPQRNNITETHWCLCGGGAV